jgi:hypothetical protein
MLLASLTDTQLVPRACSGDSAAFGELARRYRGVLLSVTCWAPPGLAREDLRQEAHLGLLEACRAYDAGCGAFGPLAGTCMRRRVMNARRDAIRHKHRPVNDVIGFDHPYSDEEGGLTLAERLAAPGALDPARIVELREELRELLEQYRWRAQLARSHNGRRLYSEREVATALELVRQGKTLREAAAAVGATHATVMRWARHAA